MPNAICEVKGCGLLADTSQKSNYCAGHTRLRRWLRKGGTLKDFRKGRSNSDLHHGRHVCIVKGCFRARENRHHYDAGNGNETGVECYYHRTVRTGQHRGAKPIPLVNYDLPIDLTRKTSCNRTDQRLTHAKKVLAYHANCTPQPDAECYKRRICVVLGCNTPAGSKGLHNGRRRYSKYCDKHRYEKKKKSPGHPKNTTPPLDTSTCHLCEWKGSCDKHRIIPGKKGGCYTRDNIIVICPNCHRLIHYGKLPPQLQSRYEIICSNPLLTTRQCLQPENSVAG